MLCLVLEVYEWMFALCCDSHLLKWATSAVRAAQLQPCLISHLITPPNVTDHRHHSPLMSFTHNSIVFNTAQIFRVMLHLICTCTYYLIILFIFIFFVPWQFKRWYLQHEVPDECIFSCIFMSAANAWDIIQLRCSHKCLVCSSGPMKYWEQIERGRTDVGFRDEELTNWKAREIVKPPTYTIIIIQENTILQIERTHYII